ncbi:MAG: bifunctional phosphoribosylaminoimidazolecarboxamide formyltransferase/IMP cyclohydrolase [Gammaproteobacteria bacterium]|nr:bifunctional phosphoribosylaminoimidazolecarboxamide formyltransferase/IMP cyclohydrolase [Gammaproteobacteria bacterium]
MTDKRQPLQRALISVSDKTGITELARGLIELGVEILSTGGTARQLQADGLAVTEVASYTGFPEMLDGRVKTLHPKIHGGILGRRDLPEHLQQMEAQGIPQIDLVVVNLYPFEATIARDDCDLSLAIENIDIGGPSMLRAAAKNHAAVGVVVDPADYPALLTELRTSGELAQATRFRLAARAFAHSARYDTAIANYLGGFDLDGQRQPFPDVLGLHFDRTEVMRYGENPHQGAAFYRESAPLPGTIPAATQRQGKALSFNNVADADAALEAVKLYPESPACVIVKHANPCGVAVAESLEQAYQLAFATDPTSSFGGIIAFNQPLDAGTARTIIAGQFVEVIIAPEVTPDALAVLAEKPNIRVLESGLWPTEAAAGRDYKRVSGGLLVQDTDSTVLDESALRVVTRRAPTTAEQRDLRFAWRVAKMVKSNAIVYAGDGRTLGIGAGQMSRIDSARIAALKAAEAGLDLKGSAMASDAFFPFRDGLDQAAEVGVSAVIQPGGSIRDDEVIAAADERNIAMLFTGMRHFRH